MSRRCPISSRSVAPIRPRSSSAGVSTVAPGRLNTKIFNRGAEAAIQIHYRASKVKQYFKEGRALRTETTVNDTRDFASDGCSPTPTGTR